MSDTEAKRIMTTALANGWARLKPAQPTQPIEPGPQTISERKKLSGLRLNGNKRKNLRWPELDGLIGKQYHNMYNKLSRAMK